jgi:hypothetical protein
MIQCVKVVTMKHAEKKPIFKRIFYLAPVKVLGRFYQVTHHFPDSEIIELMLMPKIGARLSFSQAYELRWIELTRLGKIYNSRVQCTKMIQFLRERGYYIEFDEGELNYGEATELWN